MIEELAKKTKQIADEIITMSAALAPKMEKWSDVAHRSDGLGATECVGFINKPTAVSGLNFVVDVRSPNDKTAATLRTWCIESTLGSDDIERFDNIQLSFEADRTEARELAKKGSAVTRDDIRALLHDQTTNLTHITVSNRSGFDDASEQPLGERYELAIDAPDPNDDVKKIEAALHAVLSRLKQSAHVEASI